MAIPALRILIIDDEENIRLTLSMCLEAEGHTVSAYANIQDALLEASLHAYDLIFLDIRLGVDNGLDFLPRIRAESPWAKVVVITAYASVATAVTAMKEGAADYLPKPFTPAQVRLLTEKLSLQRQMEWKFQSLQETLGEMDPESDFPTESAEMRKALDVARRVAESQATVLISGPLGIGKGRLARAIHTWSSRCDAPFGQVVCQSVDADALDAEIFGVAQQQALDAPPHMPGKVVACNGGTLVLDEVGEWPPSPGFFSCYATSNSSG